MTLLRIPAFFIGLRYILARRDNRFISFTALVSMAGLTLGVFALVVVLSVFNGSQGLQRERTLVTVPHGDIHAVPSFPEWERALSLLQSREGVTAVAPYTLSEALMSRQGYHQVTQVRGIDPVQEARVSSVADKMLDGNLSDLIPGTHGILLGRALADNLRLRVGDPVNLVVPSSNAAGTRISLDMHRFTVRGIFDVQFSIGSSLALVHIDDSLALLGAASVADRVHLRLQFAVIDQAGAQVTRALALLEQELPGPGYQGEDWSVTEASLFNALKLEKIMTWFMLMMIVAIGAFNIVSTLVMVVAEKQADIAILRTMGASKGTIMAIFLVQGSVIGVAGIMIGAAAGMLVATYFTGIATFLETSFSPASLYMISALPSELRASDVMLTCTIALVISFIATLYPAWKASRIMPAQVLRYE